MVKEKEAWDYCEDESEGDWEWYDEDEDCDQDYDFQLQKGLTAIRDEKCDHQYF